MFIDNDVIELELASALQGPQEQLRQTQFSTFVHAGSLNMDFGVLGGYLNPNQTSYRVLFTIYDIMPDGTRVLRKHPDDRVQIFIANFSALHPEIIELRLREMTAAQFANNVQLYN